MTGKTLAQGRADIGAQDRFRRSKPESGEGMPQRIENARRGIGKRAVQIKKDMLLHQRLCSSR